MSGYTRRQFPKYELTWTECFRLHQLDCKRCRSFGHVMEHHLAPAGFKRHWHNSQAVLLLSGPGLDEGNTGPLWKALGLAHEGMASYRLDRDQSVFESVKPKR